jgi:hypothetical protein
MSGDAFNNDVPLRMRRRPVRSLCRLLQLAHCAILQFCGVEVLVVVAFPRRV